MMTLDAMLDVKLISFSVIVQTFQVSFLGKSLYLHSYWKNEVCYIVSIYDKRRNTLNLDTITTVTERAQ